MEAHRTSFLVRSIYDDLLCPTNLSQWFREDPICPLCPSPASLRHILVGCKTSLSRGFTPGDTTRYWGVWRAALRPKESLSMPTCSTPKNYTFNSIHQREIRLPLYTLDCWTGHGTGRCKWTWTNVCFPVETATKSPRPDLGLHSRTDSALGECCRGGLWM